MVAAPLTGPEKAAILLMQCDSERGARILRALGEEEVGEVMAAFARMETVTGETIDQVVDELRGQLMSGRHLVRGGVERARDLLEESLGADKAAEILEGVGATLVKRPFEFLRRADARQVVSYLQNEHPQTIALVLAYMRPEAAAMVLGGLPEDQQGDVARRLATMDRASPEVISQVEAALEPKLSSVLQQSDAAALGGVGSLVDVLNRADRATERLILEGLARDDEDLAEQVRTLLFVFEDVLTLDDRAVQLVLRQVDTKDLALALKGVQANVREKVLKNLSERAAENLLEEIDLLGPVRLKAVEEAQGKVVRIIRTLEEQGEIVISRSNDEFVE